VTVGIAAWFLGLLPSVVLAIAAWRRGGAPQVRQQSAVIGVLAAVTLPIVVFVSGAEGSALAATGAIAAFVSAVLAALRGGQVSGERRAWRFGWFGLAGAFAIVGLAILAMPM
jgi:hypothetical protein